MFSPDFKDMLLALSDAKIDYLLVGAYAVAAYGHPRAPGDLDLRVRPDAETVPKVYRRLAEFGAPLHDLTIDGLLDYSTTRLETRGDAQAVKRTIKRLWFV